MKKFLQILNLKSLFQSFSSLKSMYYTHTDTPVMSIYIHYVCVTLKLKCDFVIFKKTLNYF